jgi:ribosome-associated heat shock protein Hsp15
VSEVSAPVRLDVWLWAARFYKTRTLAKQAIDSGHVRVDGLPAKPSKLVQPGQQVRLRQGHETLEVFVLALSNERRGAPEAQQLYSETAASVSQREQARLLRRSAAGLVSDERPSKKGRRMLQKFKQSLGFPDA